MIIFISCTFLNNEEQLKENLNFDLVTFVDCFINKEPFITPELPLVAPLIISEDCTINSIKIKLDNAGDCVTVDNDCTVTISGGEFDANQTPFGGDGNTALWVKHENAVVIINDGKFTCKGLATDEDGILDTGHIDLIYCSAGTIEINGGWFEGADNSVWLLNCKDSSYQNNKASIVVKGGTFVNWNPADNVSEGEHINFVAEGYMVIEEVQENGDIWYKVVTQEIAE